MFVQYLNNFLTKFDGSFPGLGLGCSEVIVILELALKLALHRKRFLDPIQIAPLQSQQL